jgi:hypothetical protein
MEQRFQELLDRLDSIERVPSELSEGVRLAIRVADVDPEMALVRLRKMLDYVIRDVYESRLGELSGTRPLENLLQRVVKEGHFPARLAAYANGVRELGNVGQHSFGEPPVTQDVIQSFGQFVPVIEWYAQQHMAGRHAKNPGVAPLLASSSLPDATAGPTFQEQIQFLNTLPPSLSELRSGTLRAIQVAPADPEMALTRCRKVLESMIRQVYERRIAEPPGSRPLENLLQRLVKDGHLPRRLEAYANSVRMLGNVGTHGFGEGVTADDVLHSISQLKPILLWYAQQQASESLSPISAQPTLPASSVLTERNAFSSQSVVIHYPAPIAVAYRRFCNHENPTDRLLKLFVAAEAVVRYLVSLGLSDLFHCLAFSAKPDVELPDDTALSFLRRPKKLTFGGWITALRATLKALADQPCRFIQELPTMADASGHVFKLLEDQVARRNRVLHADGNVAISAGECEKLIPKLRPQLEEILYFVRFVCAYPLGFARQGLGKPSEPEKHRYIFHSCMGARVADTAKSYGAETGVSLAVEHPFVVAPDGCRLLYVWPLLRERIGQLTGRRTLYVFEEMPDDGWPFLTKIESSAIDVREPWLSTLVDKPRASHQWLLDMLRQLPAVSVLPPGLGLAEKLHPARPGELINQQLNRNIRLLAAVGAGGFSTVYAGVTSEGKQVAVKVLEIPDSNELLRFEQEFEKLKAIDYPGIVRCYDHGIDMIDSREFPWYSMEFAFGDLNCRIEERNGITHGSAPWEVAALREELLKEFQTVARAVAHLHSLDIIHRDIKPGNVLIMQGGELRLSDFGLVKDLNLSEEMLARLPRSTAGAIRGTRGYMAPEQAHAERVTKASDVYSLAILLAELATGQRPLPDVHVKSGSTLNRWPVLHNLPECLRKFLSECTDVLPDKRPPDASALLMCLTPAALGMAK